MERRVLIKLPGEQDGRLSVRVLASDGIESLLCATAAELQVDLGKGGGFLMFVV